MGDKSHQAWRQKGLYFLILLGFGLTAHFGYAAIHQDRVLFRRAEQQLQGGNPVQAMHLYQAALELGLKKPQALIRIVEAALASGNIVAAEQSLNNLLQSRVKPLPDQLLNLAGLFDRFDSPELARELLEHYPRQLLSRPDLTLYLAEIYRRTAWFREAELLYEQLLDVPELYEIAALGLVKMFAAQERHVEAEAVLRHVLQRNHDNRTARIYLGRILSWQGRFNEAIVEYQTALGDI